MARSPRCVSAGGGSLIVDGQGDRDQFDAAPKSSGARYRLLVPESVAVVGVGIAPSTLRPGVSSFAFVHPPPSRGAGPGRGVRLPLLGDAPFPGAPVEVKGMYFQHGDGSVRCPSHSRIV